MHDLKEAHSQALDKFADDWSVFNSKVVGYPVPPQPELLSEDRSTFRSDFMQEELDEFKKANAARDLDGAVDACIDLMYVTMGALGEMGVLVQPTWGEVQAANMRKHRGELSKRLGSKGYDAVKPLGWTAPSHARYLTITREEADRLIESRLPHSARQSPVEVKKSLGFRVMVMGHARHGKDTVCELLRDRYGARFTSSSWFCAEHVVMPALDGMLFWYKDVQACYDDRASHRKFWFDAITEYNTPDRTRLGRAIFEGHDVYCGIRNAKEFHALRNAGAFDVAVWVDASDREGPEDSSSCTVEPWMADFVLDNNGSKEDLERNLASLMGNLNNGGCK